MAPIITMHSDLWSASAAALPPHGRVTVARAAQAASGNLNALLTRTQLGSLGLLVTVTVSGPAPYGSYAVSLRIQDYWH